MLHTLLKNEPLKSEMLVPIKSSLEHMYCHHDGWKLYNKYNWTNKCFDFLLQQEGRGIGLLNKLKAYKLQESGMDTVEANLELGFTMDQRDYGVGAQILRDLGIRKLKLITNNPKKRVALKGYGLEIVDNIKIEIAPNSHNESYLLTKRDKMGHEILKG